MRYQSQPDIQHNNVFVVQVSMNQDEPIIGNSLLRNRSRSYDYRIAGSETKKSRKTLNLKDDNSEDITNFSTPEQLDVFNDKDSNREQDIEKDEKQLNPIDNPYLKYANYTSLMLENKGSVARDHVSEIYFNFLSIGFNTDSYS